MNIGELFIVFVAICGVSFVPLMIIWFVVDAAWFQQRRWTVWYPPEGDFKGAWRRACNYWTARDYASIFGGTVYSERERKAMKNDRSEEAVDER